MPEFRISAGSSLSFGELTPSGDFPSDYTKLNGCTEIPEIGGSPETVETTSLDNPKRRTYVQGLQDTGNLDFPFNLEVPSASSNINVICGLDKNKVYAWKITYASGIVIKFKSKPNYSYKGVGINEIEGFTLHLTPMEEPVEEVPEASL